MFWSRTNPIARRTTLGNPLELFGRFMNANPFSEPGHGFPAFNLWSDEDGAVLTSELPGVKIEDLEITVSGKQITVKGYRSESECRNESENAGEGKANCVRRERPAGMFERSFQLPWAIETSGVQAKFRNGVLEITLPRAENDKPRKISVNGK